MVQAGQHPRGLAAPSSRAYGTRAGTGIRLAAPRDGRFDRAFAAPRIRACSPARGIDAQKINREARIASGVFQKQNGEAIIRLPISYFWLDRNPSRVLQGVSQNPRFGITIHESRLTLLAAA